MTDDPTNPAGIMIPIPQYPLYTATIAEYGAAPVSNYCIGDWIIRVGRKGVNGDGEGRWQWYG